MIIYPAIDLKDGQCVRLYKGDMNQNTVYNDNQAAQGAEWAASGLSLIHIVDLNGAIDGRPVNEEAVKSIIETVDIPVQLGGGIRNLQQIENWINEGVSRIILGTVALKNPEIVKEACRLFPGQIAVGIDARAGMVAVEGWVEESNMKAADLARMFEDEGVSAIIYTDIDRDGTGEGVNLESTIELSQATSIPIIASGGIGSLDDVFAVRKASEEHNINGVIIGKALYDQRVNPAKAIAIASNDDILNDVPANTNS